jgi:tetratricopeptide (TPR) repeat protein
VLSLRRADLAVVVLLCLGVVSCRSRESKPATQAQPAHPALQPVKMPDVSRNPPVVQRQLQEQYAALEARRSNASTAQQDLGDAYGRTGMLFMAAEYYAEAEAALLDAEALVPTDMRWPYYLGHLYRMRGDAPKSAAAFERAVHADPSYSAALVYLADAYLDQGKPDEADRLYAQALMQQPRMVAALFGRGRAALARRDYSTAIADLEQALALDPQARVIHYPLAMAYRGAGQLEKAQAHLTPDNSGELKPPDPVLDDMNAALESPVAYELRGGRALDAGDWDDAARLFRRGLELAPDEAALRHKLATALALKGDRRAALATFQETTRRSPGYVKSHYSLGLLYAEAGNPSRAAQEFTTALRYDPNYVEARLQLAELLRHTGKPGAALPHYDKVLELDPRMAEAAYGDAMALVLLRRYRDARDRLDESLRRHPDHPAFAIALARVLAAAPDDQVRDGMRALQLLQSVPEDARRTFDWGLAMGMALAETRQYDQATAIQQQAIALASGNPEVIQSLTQTLRLYQQNRPCRRPWSEGEPMEMVDRPTA